MTLLYFAMSFAVQSKRHGPVFLFGPVRSYSYEWSGDEEEIIKAKDGPDKRVAMMEKMQEITFGNGIWYSELAISYFFCPLLSLFHPFLHVVWMIVTAEYVEQELRHSHSAKEMSNNCVCYIDSVCSGVFRFHLRGALVFRAGSGRTTSCQRRTAKEVGGETRRTAAKSR